MLGYRTRTTDEVKDLVVTYVWAEPDLVLMVVDDVTAERAALEELKVSPASSNRPPTRYSSPTEPASSSTSTRPSSRSPALRGAKRWARTRASSSQARRRASSISDCGRRCSTTFQGQTVRRRDGTLFTAVQTITPMTDQEGKITHLVSVLKDMTEQIRHHEQETELRLAGRVQKRLFPTQPPQIANYDIAGAVFPANATSGDVFDYVEDGG